MKTSRYRGHVLATITDRDLYYGGIGESYQVGQVLIFAAGTKPKPGSEMACADNMAAATEYLDGGGSPAAIPEPARLQEDPAPAPQAPSDGRLEAIVAEARMAAEALERDAAAQRRHTDALEAELAAEAAARDEAEAGRQEADRQIEQAEKRAAESEAALRAATEALERAGEDRARLEGIVAVETAARAEAEAQLEEAASARDEALARLGSLERDAASFAVAKGAADGGGGGQGRPRAERGETRKGGARPRVGKLRKRASSPSALHAFFFF